MLVVTDLLTFQSGSATTAATEAWGRDQAPLPFAESGRARSRLISTMHHLLESSFGGEDSSGGGRCPDFQWQAAE